MWSYQSVLGNNMMYNQQLYENIYPCFCWLFSLQALNELKSLTFQYCINKRKRQSFFRPHSFLLLFDSWVDELISIDYYTFILLCIYNGKKQYWPKFSYSVSNIKSLTKFGYNFNISCNVASCLTLGNFLYI